MILGAGDDVLLMFLAGAYLNLRSKIADVIGI
jgi:hypothetical protein